MPARGDQRGVEAGGEPLRAGLLVSGRAVDLAGEEEARQPLDLKRRIELAGVDMVVFDGVAGPQDFAAFEARDRADDLRLDVLGKRGGDAVRVDGRVVEAFRLEENLVAVALAEAHHLVLDRRAIARTAALDAARIHRRPAEVPADHLMGRVGRACDVAGDLAVRDARRERRERLGRVVAVLNVEAGIVDGASVEPWRRAGLQAAERKPGGFETARQAERRRLSGAARRDLALADMDQAAQEGAGRQHDRAGAEAAAVGRHDARCAAGLDDQIVDLAFDDFEIFGLGQRALDRRGVEPAVLLRAGAADRGSFAAIEQAKLDAAFVGAASHQPVERVDLADEMALAEPADRGVAGHRADCAGRLCDERRSCAGAGRRGRRLAPGMAAADDDDIEAHVCGLARGAHSPRDIAGCQVVQCFT